MRIMYVRLPYTSASRIRYTRTSAGAMRVAVVEEAGERQGQRSPSGTQPPVEAPQGQIAGRSSGVGEARVNVPRQIVVVAYVGSNFVQDRQQSRWSTAMVETEEGAVPCFGADGERTLLSRRPRQLRSAFFRWQETPSPTKVHV